MESDTSARLAAPAAPVPAWLRASVEDPDSVEDAAFAASAALTALDTVVRRQEPWAGVWRQRLALTAATATAQRSGRIEDEAALRDALLLTRPGDEVGPGGRMLLAWRKLVSRSAEILPGASTLVDVAADLGVAIGEDKSDEIDAAIRPGAGGQGNAVGAAADAIVLLERSDQRAARALGPWLADAIVANRLGWLRAVPLLGAYQTPAACSGRLSRVDQRQSQSAWRQHTFAAYARAALQAVDLSAELGRRADRLLAVAPKLRARESDAVVEKLLGDDAVVASQDVPGMSDRGLRRLFDRLVDLGAVRELSGRTSFRIHGL
jgi:hypothetical protein